MARTVRYLKQPERRDRSLRLWDEGMGLSDISLACRLPEPVVATIMRVHRPGEA